MNARLYGVHVNLYRGVVEIGEDHLGPDRVRRSFPFRAGHAAVRWTHRWAETFVSAGRKVGRVYVQRWSGEDWVDHPQLRLYRV